MHLLRSTTKVKRFLADNPLNMLSTKPIYYTCTLTTASAPLASICAHGHGGLKKKKTSSIELEDWVSKNKLFQNYPNLLLLEKCQSLNQLNQILSYVFVSGLHRIPFVMTRVLNCCLRQNNLRGQATATVLFSKMVSPNTFSWNLMIKAFTTSYNSTDVLLVFYYYIQMLRQESLPDKYTFPLLFEACGSVSDLAFAQQLQSHTVKFGYISDLFVQNTLLHVYCIVSESLVDVYRLFDEMTDRDVVSWTTLISGLVAQGHYAQSLFVFTKMMMGVGVWPNVATMLSMISACANLGSLEFTSGFHTYLEKSGWVLVEVSIRNSLIDAYAKCGSICCAKEVFSEIKPSQRDAYSWTAIIAGLAFHGCGMEAIGCFSRMKKVVGLGVFPDAVTFIAILSACAHTGLVDEGMEIFESMEHDFGIVPELQHYGCVVDLLGRAGFLEHAYFLLEKMPMEPNLAILGSLLSACRVHNNLMLGEAILKKIGSSCEYGGGAPVLLANMYANENRYGEVVNLRKRTRERKDSVKKPPGKSWIEVKGVVYEFVVGDQSHPQFIELHMLLNGLRRLLLL